MADGDNAQSPAGRPLEEIRLERASWGLFFWIGISLLLQLGWALGLLGVGIIILGTQVARKRLALRVEGFWIAIGSLFVLGGIWEGFKIQVGLVPILCIAVGLALLVSALVKKQTG